MGFPVGFSHWSYDIPGAALVVDAAHVAPVSPVSVHVINEPSEIPISAPSMGTLVTWWIELLDTGACVYDRAAGRWQLHQDRIPAHYDRRLMQLQRAPGHDRLRDP